MLLFIWHIMIIILIIQLQDYFPNSLKYITINEKELELINKNNYQYIRKLNCSNSKNITDNSIKYLTQLTKLSCMSCPNITDKGIQPSTRLALRGKQSLLINGCYSS
jgi:hypothetical protein